jgi:hypothetical protein
VPRQILADDQRRRCLANATLCMGHRNYDRLPPTLDRVLSRSSLQRVPSRPNTGKLAA